ncbi:MAG: hypothetical protein JKY60_13150 [Kordiimonadaceae bacterium]|nr:hypothetical protein [Kordiimonadaceae bacterium]
MDTKSNENTRVFARQVATLVEDREIASVAGGTPNGLGCDTRYDGDTVCSFGALAYLD